MMERDKEKSERGMDIGKEDDYVRLTPDRTSADWQTLHGLLVGLTFLSLNLFLAFILLRNSCELFALFISLFLTLHLYCISWVSIVFLSSPFLILDF